MTSLTYATIVGRFAELVGSTETPLQGTVTALASQPIILAPNVDPMPTTEELRKVIWTLVDGEIPAAQLLANDDPNVKPIGFTWRISFQLTTSQGEKASRTSFSINTPGGSTVDLTTASPVPASKGVAIVTGDEGPAGQGVPEGGNAGWLLSKTTNADFDTQWIPPGEGGGGSGGGSVISVNERAPDPEGNVQVDIADITGLAEELATHTSEITTTNGAVGALQTTTNGQGVSIGNLNSQIGAQQVAINGVVAAEAVDAANISTLNGQVSGLTASQGVQDVGITNLNNEMAALTTVVGGKETVTEKGVAGGYAALDSTGHVPASQIPGSSSAFTPVATFADLPEPGDADTVYVTTDTNAIYRWNGLNTGTLTTDYTEIPGSPGSTDDVSEGVINLYFTNARAVSALASALSAKANVTDVNGALALKANITDMNTLLALKANVADVNTALGLKANATDVTAALALKANVADMTSALALKANTSDMTTALAGKQPNLPAGGNSGEYLRGDLTWQPVPSGTLTTDSYVIARTEIAGVYPVRGSVASGTVIEWMGVDVPTYDNATYAHDGDFWTALPA